VTGKSQRNKARRRSVRDRKAARRIVVILHAMGITPKSTGHSWTEVLDGLREQYASMTEEQRREAHDIGIRLIRGKRFDVISTEILLGPSQPKRNDRPPHECRGKGKWPQKCDRCWAWGFKSLWKSRESAEAFCVGEKDPGLNAYPCPHGNGWYVGHRSEQNHTDV